jgi:methylmalonyl-CoA mutase N-terminal domain/subunit
VERLYTPADELAGDYLDKLGFPGTYPFTRGVQPNHVPQPLLDHAPIRGLWHRRGINKRYRYLLSQGTTGLSVAFDLPTQIGYGQRRPPLALGEVGKVGVAIDSARRHGDAASMQIPLDKRLDVA